eukprot:830381-Pleurochrysis_carterae.AAC.1
MLAYGVPWSAKDCVTYSPTHDRSSCTKPLLNFEVGYPAQVPLSTAGLRRLATYPPSAYLPADHQ